MPTPEEEAAAAAAAKAAADKAAADKAAADKIAADAAAAAAATKGKTAEELAALVTDLQSKLKGEQDQKAELLKETMKKKAAKEAAEQSATENATKLETVMGQLTELFGADVGLDKLAEAIKSKKTAEDEALRKAGDFDGLKARLIDEHKKQVQSLEGKSSQEIGTLKKELDSASAEIRRLLVSNSFASSTFIKDELNLTPGKAERLFGENFKVVATDGKRSVAAFLGDKPLTDAEGKAKSFDEALREIIDADEEKETLFKPKAARGAGSGNDNQGARGAPKEPLRGVAAITAGLSAKGARK